MLPLSNTIKSLDSGELATALVDPSERKVIFEPIELRVVYYIFFLLGILFQMSKEDSKFCRLNSKIDLCGIAQDEWILNASKCQDTQKMN